jgi:hypothetical protein
MHLVAYKTFLNSHTRQLTRAGEEFEVEDGYGKDLERAGLVGAPGTRPPPLAPPHVQAFPGAPSSVGKAVAPITSSQISGSHEGLPSSSPLAPASTSKTVTTPAAPKRP